MARFCACCLAISELDPVPEPAEGRRYGESEYHSLCEP